MRHLPRFPPYFSVCIAATMGFSKNQLEELNYIEIRLRQIESMSLESGVDLDNWMAEADFPEVAESGRAAILARNEARGALFSSVAPAKTGSEVKS
ncbi:MAG: hypothetical protein ACKORE_07030 [Bacteroidota bacterium]